MANKKVNFYEGSKEAFDNLANKEANAFYNIDGELHFGEDKLQTETDETLNTEDKTIVGAINELNAKPHLTEEQVDEKIAELKDKLSTDIIDAEFFNSLY